MTRKLNWFTRQSDIRTLILVLLGPIISILILVIFELLDLQITLDTGSVILDTIAGILFYAGFGLLCIILRPWGLASRIFISIVYIILSLPYFMISYFLIYLFFASIFDWSF